MIKALLFLTSLTILSANQEFKYIQPISVEIAPKEDIKTITQEETIQEIKIIDSDGDGITDEEDQCENTTMDAKVKENGCEFDDDDDGIMNSKDKCPETNHDFMVDGYGCPQTATIKVSFLPNNSKISSQTMDELDKFADFLKEHATYQVIIYGYTDTSGNEDDNIKISKQRATSVVNALVDLGISDIRLTSIGKGSQDPIADNDTYEGRTKNRRVEVELLH